MESEKQSKILIVDDTPQNIDVLIGVLKNKYKTIAATNGELALKLAVSNHPPDLILLDIMMPNMDGYEVCRRLKANPKTDGIPVIFVTAMTEAHDETLGFKVGGVDYITKPITPSTVLARVETHLQLRSAYHFIRETFGRYLSTDIVNNLIDSPQGLELGGERRKVSILMSDLRGFTSIAEGLPPETVVSMINIFLARMTDVIQKHQGTIDEFIGDAILAIFGAPVQRSDDALRATKCAIDMQLAMKDVIDAYEERGFPKVEMGIGINTGEVFVGNIGSNKRSKYAVVGRHVNTTSRIESYTIGGQIFISESTREECGDLLRIDGEEKVMPKGMTKEISIFDVGGVYGEDGLELPNKKPIQFKKLSKPVALRISKLEGKHVDEGFSGYISAIEQRQMLITTEQPCDEFSNIKIQVAEDDSIELYAKVMKRVADQACNLQVHITSSPSEMEVFLNAHCNV